jgi:DNA-nicking Smr family endonuclease
MPSNINAVGQAVRPDADEGELFREAVRGATPLADRLRVPAAKPTPSGLPRADPPVDSRGMEVDDGGGRAFGVSRKTLRQLAAGRLPPQATLDLHGHSARVARERLDRFVIQARTEGLRVVLVITGKGERPRGRAPASPGERLRDLVPTWLAGPLAPALLAFTPARAEHGGAGAIYLLLRSPTP